MTSETLLRYIPNYIAPGMGEPRLIDKIAPYLESADTWADANLASEDFVCHDETLQQTRENIIAARALYLAAPALDVTMHPNGLAVVNTDSVAPASAERSREFRRALDRQVISRIDFFLEYIASSKDWARFIRSAPAASLWCATIFYSPSDIISFTGIESSWEEVAKAIHCISQIENYIAEKYISLPLLKKWRFDKGLQRNPPSAEEFAMLRSLKSIIADSLKREDLPGFYTMQHIINELRNNPDRFPEWHRSDTAKLFSPPVFHNNKSSGGYFF